MANPHPAKPAPPLFAARHWIIYVGGSVLFVLLFFMGIHSFRKGLDDYQVAQPRYAAERALKALEAGNADQTRREIDALMDDWPNRRSGGIFNRPVEEVWEGRVMRNRVSILERLASKLLAAGMGADAERVGWKMLLEYHIASRVVEHIDQWEWMFHIKGANQDWTSTFEIARILGLHGVTKIRAPKDIEPYGLAINPTLTSATTAQIPSELTGLFSQYYQAIYPSDYEQVARNLTVLRPKIKSPTVRQRVEDTIHQALIKANRPEQAHAFFSQIWGRDLGLMDIFWRDWPTKVTAMNPLDRDPTLLGMMWRDRPPNAKLNINEFIDTFRTGDPRISVVNFNKLTRKDIGYFYLNNKVFPAGDHVNMSQGIAAAMPVQVTRTVYRVYIAYEAFAALGINPIILVRVNDGPYTPLYCDSEKPDMVYFDTKLTGPATYSFEFVYLNDAAFQYQGRNINENRDLRLYRMALVQVPPKEQ